MKFEKCDNSSALFAAMYFLRFEFEGFSFPLKPNYYFDLIAYRSVTKKEFERIKVIHTNYKNRNGKYEANLRRSGGYSKTNNLKKNFDFLTCDYLFIFTPENSYFIPSKDIECKRAIVLSKYNKFIVRESSSAVRAVDS